MIDDHTRWAGRRPWDETWFIEGTTRDGHGLWLRYTLTDGSDGRAAMWAAWRPAGGSACTGYVEVPLDAVVTGGDTLVGLPSGHLSPARAQGEAGPLSWDLALHGSGWWHSDLVPAPIGRLGKTYRAAIPDLTALGTVTVDGTRHDVQVIGVLGHLWGARSRVKRWGWAHGARFDEAPGTVLEVLAAQLAVAGRPVRPVASVVLHHRGRTWAYNQLRHLLRSRVSLGDDRFEVVARGRTSTLRATLQLPERSRCVLARYDAPDGTPTFCRNAPGAGLSVHLTRFGREVASLHTQRAVGELADTAAPDDPPVLGRTASPPA